MDPSDGVCLGCYRTRAEIASWRSMDEADQLLLLDILSERRAAAASSHGRVVQEGRDEAVAHSVPGSAREGLL